MSDRDRQRPAAAVMFSVAWWMMLPSSAAAPVAEAKHVAGRRARDVAAERLRELDGTVRSFSPETMVETVAALQEGIFAVDPHLRTRQRVAPVRILRIFDRCSMPLTRREAIHGAMRFRAATRRPDQPPAPAHPML